MEFVRLNNDDSLCYFKLYLAIAYSLVKWVCLILES